MLLSSPSFSDFLERLSTNPSQLPQGAPQMEQQQQQQQQVARQAPKDVNPYAAQQQMHRQSIGVAMIPEQHIDFSAMGADAEAYNFQPQVYAVLETPETPLNIDTAALSGKSSNFVGESFDSDDEKVEMPVIEQPPVVEEKATAPKAPEVHAVVDDELENDPEFALYHESSPAIPTESATPIEIDTDDLSEVDVFGGIESEKFLARYELLDASEEEQKNAVAMASVQRRLASLEAVCARLEMMTTDI